MLNPSLTCFFTRNFCVMAWNANRMNTALHQPRQSTGTTRIHCRTSPGNSIYTVWIQQWSQPWECSCFQDGQSGLCLFRNKQMSTAGELLSSFVWVFSCFLTCVLFWYLKDLWGVKISTFLWYWLWCFCKGSIYPGFLVSDMYIFKSWFLINTVMLLARCGIARRAQYLSFWRYITIRLINIGCIHFYSGWC